MLNSPGAVVVVVAGAANAGGSTILETLGPRGGPLGTYLGRAEELSPASS